VLTGSTLRRSEMIDANVEFFLRFGRVDTLLRTVIADKDGGPPQKCIILRANPQELS
jgi:hypothetical protein